MKVEKANQNNPRPIIVLGDIHGSTYWKEIVNGNPGCRYIFLGDYLDPYRYVSPEKLMDNLEEIIRLKKARKDDVILLLGNHDLHYIHLDIEPCTRFDYEIEDAAHALFTENMHLFMNAFQEGKRIFTHAGISEKWFFDDFYGNANENANENIADQLNNPHPDQIPALYRCGAMRGGDHAATGGIFWADINELGEPLPGYIQFAGHNRVDEICEYSNNGGKITFCDCLYSKKYLKLDWMVE
jgi:hypothetical protein